MRDLADEPLERQLTDQQLGALLILSDLLECHAFGPEAVGLLHPASDRRKLPSRLHRQLLARGLSNPNPNFMPSIQTIYPPFKATVFSGKRQYNYILNGLDNALYNVYSPMVNAKALWESLERKYKTEDAGSKKFVVGKFLDFKMMDSKTVISQVQEFQLILHDIHAEGMVLGESFQVAALIEKLPPTWKDFKNYLKHKRKEMKLEDLIVRLRIEEDNRQSEKKAGNYHQEAKANVVEQGYLSSHPIYAHGMAEEWNMIIKADVAKCIDILAGLGFFFALIQYVVPHVPPLGGSFTAGRTQGVATAERTGGSLPSGIQHPQDVLYDPDNLTTKYTNASSQKVKEHLDYVKGIPYEFLI
ncbi:hypothetical protein RJ639_017827 [Escallonia herrerae]|uniref:Uncharacterized protein n=1 Tax=Escallonia herrerae TaxID=1293975 RepID=A0AA89ALY9_9ASTE|nr:hypothetical protein RJ639_017827 [Escallonia herrerae]